MSVRGEEGCTAVGGCGAGAPVGAFRFSVQERFQRDLKPCDVARLALPEGQNLPPERFQLLLHFGIAAEVGVELAVPVLDVARRASRAMATGMPMPETAVNEDYLVVPRQDDIGAAGEVSDMETKAVAESVQEGPNRLLRPGVARSNSRHHSAAFLC